MFTKEKRNSLPFPESYPCFCEHLRSHLVHKPHWIMHESFIHPTLETFVLWIRCFFFFLLQKIKTFHPSSQKKFIPSSLFLWNIRWIKRHECWHCIVHITYQTSSKIFETNSSFVSQATFAGKLTFSHSRTRNRVPKPFNLSKSYPKTLSHFCEASSHDHWRITLIEKASNLRFFSRQTQPKQITHSWISNASAKPTLLIKWRTLLTG